MTTELFSGITASLPGVGIVSPLIPGEAAHPPQVTELYAEARLGELIKQEQEAGRLATQSRGTTQFGSGNNNTPVKTLADYGLDKEDSRHAQALAEHKDIIAEKRGFGINTVAAAISEFPTRCSAKLDALTGWTGQLHTMFWGQTKQRSFVETLESYKNQTLVENFPQVNKGNRPTKALAIL
jgi:hypothetical protein